MTLMLRFMLVYIDDLIISGSFDSQTVAITKYLQVSLAIKDLGSLSVFLCIEVTCFKEGLFLSHHKYIVDLLCRFKLEG